MQRPTFSTKLALSALVAAALACSCAKGSADPKALLSDGNRALGSRDWDSALTDFQEAAAALGNDAASDPLYLDVQKGLLRAQAGAAPAQAVSSLKTLGKSLGDALDVNLYSSVALDMSAAGHFDEAVEVVALAKERFGESELLDQQVANIREKMKSAGATKALDSLAGLGYVGD